jgi:cullin 1
LSDKNVVGLLHSVVCGKYKILVKEPTNNTILRSDYFEFNPGFTNQKIRIEIPRPVVNEDVEPGKILISFIDGDNN